MADNELCLSCTRYCGGASENGVLTQFATRKALETGATLNFTPTFKSDRTTKVRSCNQTNTMEYDLLVINGIVVTDKEIGEFDIAIKDEKIKKVVPKGTLGNVASKQTIDAKGGYVMVRTIPIS